MERVLVLGINKSIHTTLKIIKELEKEKVLYVFLSWKSISFLNGRMRSNGKRIGLKSYSAVFYDVPSYYLIVNKKVARKIPFDLDNELDLVLKKLKKNKIPAINRDFLISYPFYNKFTQSELFNQKKIPTIPTLHLTDNECNKVISEIKTAGFKFPLVIKESNGGLGEQVWKIENTQKLRSFLKNKRNQNLIYQPFIKNRGDFRVLVIGGRSVGIMKRTARKNEWRNNFALGGSINAHKEREMEIFAESACARMGLEYAGVDILKAGKGYLVIEVNSFANFEGFEKVYPSKNIGKLIVKYLLSKR